MSRRIRSFLFDNIKGKLLTAVSYTLKEIDDEESGTEDINGTSVADFAKSSIQTSSENFSDSDTVVMTAAAIDDRIEVRTGVKANSADLATVATSGSYTDLSNKPTLFDGAYSSLTGVPTLFSGSYTDLSNKPTLFDGAYSSLTGTPNLFDGAYSSLTGVPTLFSGSYTDLSNKPTLFDGAYSSLTGVPAVYGDTQVSTYLSGNGYDTATNIVASITASAPSTLDTLNELAAALGDDPNFATTISNSIGTKLSSSHDMSLTLSGDASGSTTFTNMGNASLTVTVADDSHNHVISNVDGLQTALNAKANLAGAAFTGAITTTSTFDGRDVAADGSKLDGIESGATADQTAAEILTAIKTVDGTASGLDADLLDGQQGSYYAAASSLSSYLPLTGGTLSGNLTANTVTATSFSGDGSGLTGIEAGISTGKAIAMAMIFGG